MRAEKIKIPSEKGDIAAAVHHPKKETGRLAILCPGYLDSKDYAHLAKLAEALSERGYTAVRFDPVGTWESGGDISDYTNTQYLENIRCVLDHMLRDASYGHILLGGHSRGGQMSLLYAARNPRITAVLGIMPSSGRTVVGSRREEWVKTGFSVSWRDMPDDRNKKREFKVPYAHLEDRDKYDVTEDVKKIRVPITLIAGELDELVLPEDVKEVFDNANEPKKFAVIPGIGHDYRFNDEEIGIVNGKILELLGE